jgi:hypothetical protein
MDEEGKPTYEEIEKKLEKSDASRQKLRATLVRIAMMALSKQTPRSALLNFYVCY